MKFRPWEVEHEQSLLLLDAPLRYPLFLQDFVDAPLTIPACFTRNLNIDWRAYQVQDEDFSCFTPCMLICFKYVFCFSSQNVLDWLVDIILGILCKCLKSLSVVMVKL